ALAKAIEFTNVDRLEPEIRRMPVLVLHELAHAYHARSFPAAIRIRTSLRRSARPRLRESMMP
ncbi:MAG: hypothetical protein EBR95_06670, partial [Verrucomicrobia bacterium]|nr:hypothetical protein [Verrucomicrobiota bacterium]